MLLQIIASNGIRFEFHTPKWIISGAHGQVNVNVRRIVWNFAFALPCLAKRLKKIEQKINKKVARLFPDQKQPFLKEKTQTRRRIPHVEDTHTHTHTSLSVHTSFTFIHTYSPRCLWGHFLNRSEAHPKIRRCRGCGDDMERTEFTPENRQNPKRKGSSSNHPFSSVSFREGKFKENPRRVKSEIRLID